MTALTKREKEIVDVVAKEITDPLIQSLRKALEKIDVTAFKKPQMTRDDWDYQVNRIGWLTTLAAAYETEHDFDADEDTSATWEMLREVRAIHDEMIAALGEPPPVPEPKPADPNIPF